MSSVDWVPELAAALDELVPLKDVSRANWSDVVGRVGSRRKLQLARRRPRRSLRLAIVVALLFLLLTGAATATYLLLRGNGDIALGGGSRLLVINPENPGLHVLASCPARNAGCEISEPTWSPDGTRIAFFGGDGGPVQRSHIFLYVAAADGRGAKRLAACGECGAIGGGGRIAWSPDGKWIAFTRNSGFTWPSSSLWVVAAAGGRLHRLTDCRRKCADLGAAWSPDGRRIAFTHATHTASTSGVYTIHPDGSGLKRILVDGSDFEWSPDSRRIVFDSTPDSIAVANADGSHLRVVFAGARGTGPGTPSWSPDGRKLVFFKTPGRPGHYRAEVWTMSPDGSGKERLYHSGCCVETWAPPIWSPDGRLIAFSADSAGGTFVINTDGSGLRQLSPIAFGELSWQPLSKGARNAQSPPQPATIKVPTAAALTHPYRSPPTRSCLIRHHAHLLRSKYTSSIDETQWVLARDSSGLPSVWIAMSFLPDPSQAAIFELDDKRTVRTADGVSSAWIRHHITRRGNVVIEDVFPAHPLTAIQLATIADCLRP